MAHDPVKKAKCVIDLVSGMGTTEAAKKHKVPAPTVKLWQKEIEAEQKKSLPQTRKDLFVETYTRMGITVMEMFIRLGEAVSDPDYLKNKTTDDVIRHATFVRDSFMSFERMHSNGAAPALETRSEAIEPEVVTEE